MTQIHTHHGHCHCGAVQFTFQSAATVDVTHCNCSLCSMTGYQHVFIPEDDVSFVQGKDSLSLYTFGTHTARHYFCKVCGVKPLYRPRSHPTQWSINLRCVKGDTLIIGKTIPFNGENWEDNIKDLRTLT